MNYIPKFPTHIYFMIFANILIYFGVFWAITRRCTNIMKYNDCIISYIFFAISKSFFTISKSCPPSIKTKSFFTISKYDLVFIDGGHDFLLYQNHAHHL